MTLSRDDFHQYQERAVKRMVDDPAVFGVMGLGLGKTVSTLTAISDLVDQFMVNRSLVIAPKRVALHTWPDELKKWAHLSRLSMAVAVGAPKQRKAAIESRSDITVINRENVPWLVTNYGKKWLWDLVVVDESTSFKSSSSSRFKALKKVRPKVERVILLTATPTPNSLLEIWSQMFLIDQGEALGRTFSGFRSKYFESDYMGYNWTLKPGAKEEIEKKVLPYMLVMRTEDFLTLPPKIERVHPVYLPPAALKFYQELEKELTAEISGEDIDAINAAVLCGKLQQAAQGAIYDEEKKVHHIHDAKLDALEDLIDAAEGPVIVAYNYQHDLDRIKKRFPASVDVRQEGAIDRWNAGRLPILCCHPASAGHGLNLQSGGNTLIFFSQTWSGELDEQMPGRIYRQGQEKPVIIHRLIAQGTIDEQIHESLINKAGDQRELVKKLLGG